MTLTEADWHDILFSCISSTKGYMVTTTTPFRAATTYCQWVSAWLNWQNFQKTSSLAMTSKWQSMAADLRWQQPLSSHDRPNCFLQDRNRHAVPHLVATSCQWGGAIFPRNISTLKSLKSSELSTSQPSMCLTGKRNLTSTSSFIVIFSMAVYY